MPFSEPSQSETKNIYAVYIESQRTVFLKTDEAVSFASHTNFPRFHKSFINPKFSLSKKLDAC